MKKIIIFGAGRSSTSLIEYLLSIAKEQHLFITLLDFNEELAKSKISNHKYGEAYFIDANNQNERLKFIKGSQLVISMLPAHMHLGIVKDAIHEKVHVITPSYVTKEIRSLDEAAQNNDVLILNEMGLDPGIDHMSAKKIIDEIEDNGGKLTGFESFTGGLVAPESDDNPWNYKFTWNPRNVVLAGRVVLQNLSKKESISTSPTINYLEGPKLLKLKNMASLKAMPTVIHFDIVLFMV